MGITMQVSGQYKEVADLTPSGAIVAFGGTTAPTGWLLCDGTAVSRTIYADLFNAIGTNFGSGDGSTTFNLPDLRGAAPAGAGTSVGYTQNETLALGTKYNDQIQGHKHLEGAYYSPVFTNAMFGYISGPSASPNVQDRGVSGTVEIYTGEATVSTHGTVRPGDTTHGKLVGVNFIIKI